jgi:hypothetical protein
LPSFDKAAPAVIWPAPENCATSKSVVPNVGAPVCVNVYPLFSPTVPSSTNTNAPPLNSDGWSSGVALVNTNQLIHHQQL